MEMSLWALWNGIIQKTSFISLNKTHWANILWAQELAKGSWTQPIVPGFFFAELFVPSSILLPRLKIPYTLSSKECGSYWPKSLPGNREQLFICGFLSFVASSLTSVRQIVLRPELFHQPFPIGEQMPSDHFLWGVSGDFCRQPGCWPLKVQRPFVWYGNWWLPGISMICLLFSFVHSLTHSFM